MDPVIFLSLVSTSLQLTAVLIYYFGVVRKTTFKKGPIVLTIAMTLLFVQELFGIWLYTNYLKSDVELLKYVHMFILPLLTSCMFIWMGIKNIRYISDREHEIMKLVSDIQNNIEAKSPTKKKGG